jgi:hypothetical protein
MDNITLIVDTHSNYSDVWAPCFGRLSQYCNGIKKYAFTDKTEGLPEDIIPITYDNDQSYRDQFLSCIMQVEEKYILYTSEDYILYDYVNLEEIHNLCDILDNTEFNSVKLIKGPETVTPFKSYPNLFEIDPNHNNFFAQQASIWKTRDFEKIFEMAPKENTRMQHEPMGSSICRQLNYRILQYYSGEPKRGISHYDSSIYPYIATAVVKGKWNLSGYYLKMLEVFQEYGINPTVRGTV